MLEYLYILLIIYKFTLSSPEHAPAYMLAVNAGVVKAIVSFHRVKVAEHSFRAVSSVVQKRLLRSKTTS